jgi:hypothetical protein
MRGFLSMWTAETKELAEICIGVPNRLIEGSFEIKLPTIWTESRGGKSQRRKDSEKRRVRKEKRREEKGAEERRCRRAKR